MLGMLTQCEILQDEFFSGPKCADKPADEVPKQRNHGENLTGWFEGGAVD